MRYAVYLREWKIRQLGGKLNKERLEIIVKKENKSIKKAIQSNTAIKTRNQRITLCYKGNYKTKRNFK